MDNCFDLFSIDTETVQTEIAPGVVLVMEAKPCGDFEELSGMGDHLGICIERTIAEKILSQKAIQSARIENGCICYDAPYRYLIPLYELLESRYITDYDVIRFHDTTEMAEDGRYFCPEYFGELEQAVESREVLLAGYKHISNGIDVFHYADGDIELAIHKVAAHYELSDAACNFGIQSDFHLHYLNETCAIPLHELTDTYSELGTLVNDEAGMMEILKNNFPAYLLSVENK